MGQTGTDVAKNAADMILTDDNFVTIIEAVKEGRHIYDNIKKSVHFSISTNVGEIVTMFIGLLLGFECTICSNTIIMDKLCYRFTSRNSTRIRTNGCGHNEQKTEEGK